LTWCLASASGSSDVGTAVQAWVSGRRVPKYVVRRDKLTWGFLLESCWALYASFPIPILGVGETLEEETVTTGDQLPEVMQYNLGFSPTSLGLGDDEDDGDLELEPLAAPDTDQS
ncbi:unnamed protein product, partial [Polarella glacialis]